MKVLFEKVSKRAMVGEFVEVINPECRSGKGYNKGDICKVLNDTQGASIRIRTKENSCFVDEECVKQPFSLIKDYEYLTFVPAKKSNKLYAKVTVNVGGAPVGTVVEINKIDKFKKYRCFNYSYNGTTKCGTIGSNAVLVDNPNLVEIEFNTVYRKAELGDYIITTKDDVFGLFKKDEIIFVDGKKNSPSPNGFVWRCGAQFESDEYLTLECVDLNVNGAKVSATQFEEITPVRKQARVGEFIKIVDAQPITHHEYKNGNVFEVVEAYDALNTVFVKNPKGSSISMKNASIISTEEYVIIPKPEVSKKIISEVKEVKRAAKVGEYIKITNACPMHTGEYEDGDILEALIADGIYPHGAVKVISKLTSMPTLVYESEYVVLENYNPTTVIRKWTDVEILEAKGIVAEILFDIHGIVDTSDWKSYKSGDIIRSFRGGKVVYSKCSPNDEWNFWIGKMVGLCKVTGRALPEWVKR